LSFGKCKSSHTPLNPEKTIPIDSIMRMPGTSSAGKRNRNTATDKRTFIYPLSVIRRVIYQYDGKPYDRILLEMY